MLNLIIFVGEILVVLVYKVRLKGDVLGIYFVDSLDRGTAIMGVFPRRRKGIVD